MAAHSDWVRCLAISDDGSQLLSGSNDMSVKLWSLADGRLVHHMQAHQHLVRAVAFASATVGCSVAEDCKLIFYDLTAGSVKKTITLGPGRTPVKIHCGVPVAIDGKEDVKPEHLSLALASVPLTEQVLVGYGVTVKLIDSGTAKVDGSTLVGSWGAPLFDQSGAALSGKNIAVAHSVEYACAAVPKCAAVNSAGMPLPPLQIAL